MNRTKKVKIALLALLVGAFLAFIFSTSCERRTENQAKAQKQREKTEKEQSWINMIEEANSMLEGTSQMKSSPSFAYGTRAYAHANLGETEQALEDLKSSKKADDGYYQKSSRASEVAQVFARQGKYDEAVRLYEELVADPNCSHSRKAAYGCFLLHTKRQDLRDIPRAIGYFRAYVRENLDDYSINTELAIALASQGQFEEAIVVGRLAEKFAIKFDQDRLESQTKRVELYREKYPGSLANEEKNLEFDKKYLAKTIARYQKLLKDLEQRKMIEIADRGY